MCYTQYPEYTSYIYELDQKTNPITNSLFFKIKMVLLCCFTVIKVLLPFF